MSNRHFGQRDIHKENIDFDPTGRAFKPLQQSHFTLGDILQPLSLNSQPTTIRKQALSKRNEQENAIPMIKS